MTEHPDRDPLRRAADDQRIARRRHELALVASQEHARPRSLTWREWAIDRWNAGWTWLVSIGVRERNGL